MGPGAWIDTTIGILIGIALSILCVLTVMVWCMNGRSKRETPPPPEEPQEEDTTPPKDRIVQDPLFGLVYDDEEEDQD